MISSLGTVIVVAFGGWFALKGYVSTADIVGFIMFLGLFYQPITTLARVIEDYSRLRRERKECLSFLTPSRILSTVKGRKPLQVPR